MHGIESHPACPETFLLISCCPCVRWASLRVPDHKRLVARCVLLLLSLVAWVAVPSAQTLTLSDVDFPNVSVGDAAWGDFDGDGDLDVALVGTFTLQGALV